MSLWCALALALLPATTQLSVRSDGADVDADGTVDDPVYDFGGFFEFVGREKEQEEEEEAQEERREGAAALHSRHTSNPGAPIPPGPPNLKSTARQGRPAPHRLALYHGQLPAEGAAATALSSGPRLRELRHPLLRPGRGGLRWRRPG